MGQILSTRDGQAGPCLIAKCRRLVSIFGMGLHSNCPEGPFSIHGGSALL